MYHSTGNAQRQSTEQRRIARSKLKQIVFGQNKEYAFEVAEREVPGSTRILITEHQCIRCGVKYWNNENIGRWLCRCHPGAADPLTGTYTCCGKDVDECRKIGYLSGCRRVDHAHKNTLDFTETIVLPEHIFALLTQAPLQDAIVEITDDGIRVRRGEPQPTADQERVFTRCRVLPPLPQQ
jgi:hypothetical protein